MGNSIANLPIVTRAQVNDWRQQMAGFTDVANQFYEPLKEAEQEIRSKWRAHVQSLHILDDVVRLGAMQSAEEQARKELAQLRADIWAKVGPRADRMKVVLSEIADAEATLSKPGLYLRRAYKLDAAERAQLMSFLSAMSDSALADTIRSAARQNDGDTLAIAWVLVDGKGKIDMPQAMRTFSEIKNPDYEYFVSELAKLKADGASNAYKFEYLRTGKHVDPVTLISAGLQRAKAYGEAGFTLDRAQPGKVPASDPA